MKPKPILTWLPTEIEFVRGSLKRFIDGMVFKLRKNKAKGRWEGYDLNHTLDLLEAEVKELRQAIRDRNDVEILLEACDVANFAMIAAAIAIEGK